MKALEIRTIFTPYYLYQIKHDVEVVFAYGYLLNINRVRKTEFVRIIDEFSNRVRIEAKIGNQTYKATEESRNEIERMIIDREKWMISNGYKKIVDRYLPEDQYKRGDASRTIEEGRIFIELEQPVIVDKSPISLKVRRKEQYVDI